MADVNAGATPDKSSVDKVEETLRNMSADEKEQILGSFNEFKRYLASRIELAQNLGLGEEQIAQVAQKVANYLATSEEPRNREEKLLQELWKAGTQDEQHKLAHMLVRLAQA
ncbi:DUF3243 domain-containing protein [Paenibacillus xerothermodurans]|uniref:DUF3243 domain-containing protein n=1 Tax=Paenibacillus xerothermodurans TaxID=1977292 RepID=A0A2W1NQV3_PAEXE|nr:DUF3243 domain-containing protein [Paenibacillus xerothermodurans]PZE20116.1 DUF3243 domain-containing protein [Paenibacillus xerothermodurans]